MRQVLAEVGAVLDTAGTPADAVDVMLASVDRYTGADPASLLSIEAYLAATRDEQLREQIAGVVDGFRQRFGRWLGERGVPAPDETAAVLVAAVDGLLLHRGLGADARPVAAVAPVWIHAVRRRALLDIRRPDLERVLREQLPPGVDLRFGTGPVAVTDRGDGLRVTLDDGAELEADLLVGADGIHSTVRRPGCVTGHRRCIPAGRPAGGCPSSIATWPRSWLENPPRSSRICDKPAIHAS